MLKPSTYDKNAVADYSEALLRLANELILYLTRYAYANLNIDKANR